jgi:CheY-like chemotaxis protein
MNSIRVLHIDDEPDIREVVEISLGLDPGFEMRSCSSGQEALALVTHWLPDIILLDVMMPVMDGPATLALLRESVRTVDVPVLFMTARAQNREIELFRSLGAAGVIQKPFDPMKLAASVRAHIDSMEGRLHSLSADFRVRLDEDAAALTRHQAALADGTAGPDTLAQIRDIAHRLAGAGGVFDFNEVGSAAAALEDAIALSRDDADAGEKITSALNRLLADVERARTLRTETAVLEA